MKVLLMQHGKPVPEAEDPARPLSEQGRREVQAVARFLKGTGTILGEILHSGKTRARETADLVASAMDLSIMPREERGLSPLDDVREIAQRIADMEHNILICGHLPHLGKLTSLLVTGEESFDLARFQQGGVLCLERGNPKEWVIAWMIVPGILG
ncbi:MAG: phosphohistidine phosphatase SixA [Deltaproteobacteria bacterium]|nr:phosphohistidine phosphatase SixA [Deltaproteobacteria bacterium]MBW2136111.1 phosphohistidine phosphatase SixA [Deltaproteobacteria bacterium]